MAVDDFFYAIFGFFITGAVSALIFKHNDSLKNYIAHGLAALGSITVVLGAVSVFIAGPAAVELPFKLLFENVMLKIDYLSAFFLLAVGVVGTAASIYAMGYAKEYHGTRLSVMAALYNTFLLAMVLVLTAGSVLVFVVFWEIMTVASFFLVNFEYNKPEHNKAAFVYIIMTHVGTVFIITAFLLLAQAAGSMDFSALGKGGANELIRNIAFLCALIGFGAKAGIIPVHIWLPMAHPAAPTHVSALMSGVMIKTAIYGLSRFCLDFLGTGPVWWGGLILLLAAVSSVMGILYALMEKDIKRLLAYCSVENIGVILLGVGAGMVFMSKGQPALAALAWAAGLYHLFNHAIFKSLLFMGAGAVYQAAHTRDLEQLGGLIKKMPYTAALFLFGAAAISAMPPLNGFVSEWLTFQSLLFIPQALGGVAGKITAAVLIAVLGLTGALAAAAFAKAFGIAFLAKPRTAEVEQAREVSPLMLVPSALLAGLCIVLGLWPTPMLAVIGKVVAAFGTDAGILANGKWYAIAFSAPAQGGGVLAMPVILLILVIGVAGAYLIYRFYGKPQAVQGETWTCGIVPTARMEYSATGFSKPLRTAFRLILRPQREIIYETDSHRYWGRKLSYYVSITYVFNKVFYSPLNSFILRAAKFIRRIQTGSVQLYIGYVTAVTVIILIWSTGW